MGKILSIAKRETTSLFYSPIAYLVLFLFMLVSGFLFMMFVFVPGQVSELRQLADYLRFGLFFIVPAMTMSLLSDEYRSGRIEMLRTSPITEFHLLIGKYLGGLFFYCILLASTLIFILLLTIYGRPDWGQTAAAYLGLLLLGMMFVAIGLFFSSCTQSQVVALLATLLTLAFLTFAGLLGSLAPTWWGFIPLRQPLNYLGVGTHIADFARGIVGVQHLVYFLGFTFVFLFMTYLVLESRKWR